MEILEKDKLTSLDLLKEINLFREQEYQYKVDNNLELGKVEEKRGSYVELQHKTLLGIIRDEFEEEITEQKILPSEYIDDSGKSNTMYILDLEQSKQVLLRESKFVRKGVLQYIKNLENRLKQVIENKDLKVNSDLLNMEKDKINIEKAKLLKDIASSISNDLYKETLLIYSANTVANEKILELPKVERSCYSATELSKIALEKYGVTVTANKIGRIANKYNLKTEEYGKLFYDKAKYTNKQIEVFRYYIESLEVILKLGGYIGG